MVLVVAARADPDYRLSQFAVFLRSVGVDGALDDVRADRPNRVQDVLLVGLLTRDVGRVRARSVRLAPWTNSMGGGRLPLLAALASKSSTELFLEPFLVVNLLQETLGDGCIIFGRLL